MSFREVTLEVVPSAMGMDDIQLAERLMDSQFGTYAEWARACTAASCRQCRRAVARIKSGPHSKAAIVPAATAATRANPHGDSARVADPAVGGAGLLGGKANRSVRC